METSEEEGDRIILNSIRDHFARVLPKGKKIENFDQFLKKRYDWISSGGAPN